jgi:SAM-dependent methyltransferase
VLDVGGGTGWMLTLLRQLSPRIAETHEVDIDSQAQADAEAAGHVFHCCMIEDFETDRKFDLILMLNLIEHVADPAGVLRAASQLLSPQGLLLIKTPNVDTLDQRIFRHRNWGGFHCPRHFVLFTMGGFKALAERCGLEVVEAKYTQGGPQWACSVMALFTRWGLTSVTFERPMPQHPLYNPLQMAGAAFDFCRLPLAKTAQMFVSLRRRR